MKETKNQVEQAEMSLASSSDLTNLREKAGFIGRLNASGETKKAAAAALQAVQVGQVQAEKNIQLTSLKLAEASILTSMVGNALPAIGALTVRVNAATTAVDQALTNGAMAETYTHLKNRGANIALAKELRTNAQISIEEEEVIVSFAQADAAQDIQSSRQRMSEGKEALGALHKCALGWIAAAKDKLQ